MAPSVWSTMPSTTAPWFGALAQSRVEAESHLDVVIRHPGERHDKRRLEMQYALLIYQGTTPLPDTDAWASLPAAEQQAIYADYAALDKRPGVTPGLPLGLAEKAKTVRVVEGTLVATDGPYAEPVGGYLVLEANDLDAAVEVAAAIPAARHGGAIEIRPVETYW
jgi:hypothetical protein